MQLFKVWFTRYSPNYDEWLPRKNLKNVPEILREWEQFQINKKEQEIQPKSYYLCRNSTWSYGPQGLPNQACD
jgi:hypothetical protein